MKFGPVPIEAASGCILGHGTSAGELRLKKGHLLTPDDITRLRAAGLAQVIAAELEANDIPEDEAAARIAEAAGGPGTKLQAAFTGRANLYASAPGMALIDADRINRLNLVHEALTIATVSPFEMVEAGRMLATVKVIPFAAPRAAVATCVQLAGEAGPLVQVAPFQSHRVGLIATRLSETKSSVLAKTEQAVRERLEALGSELGISETVAHEPQALAGALQRLLGEAVNPILIFGATAIVDRRDVIPAAIKMAGGQVDHFGMPVDPGNLLLLGHHGNVPLVGVPGCARSPKLNGFDWVLRRLLAGLAVTPRDIMQMGVGGLLKEIPSRPQPRQGGVATKGPRAPRIAALILAAGRSRRMGFNKMLEPIDGEPMIQRVVDTVLASAARPVFVILGHEKEKLRKLLSERDVILIENPQFKDGLSTSLKAGLAALPEEVDGTLVCLGDMPKVQPQQIDRLIAAFNPLEGRAIIVPTWAGKRGNPVLFGARFFAEMKTVAGDTGARHLIGDYQDLVREVPMEDDGVLLDIDTPETLAQLQDQWR